ncbi:MAG: ABC transporter ATP-binding protein [Pseudomonadota bacterium]
MLEVSGLSLRIGALEILRDVSFSVAPGQVFGLVGESGSGKSMTALAVMRLVPGSAQVTGVVRFEGAALLEQSERAMNDLRGRDIGMIFQEPMTALNPVQRIGDQVAETLIVHGAASRSEALRVARERLARVGLGAIALGRYPHELSGGQRQRVCIAMAIALRPKLLIADEPTTALDVTTQAQILDLLKGLVAEEGLALMLITHDLAVVAGMADRVAVMRDGAIVDQGATEPLFRNRAHPYTARLMADSVHQPVRRALEDRGPLLEVSALRRSYPGPRQGLFKRSAPVEAVRGVSFALRAGESLGLVGESGCGKSTLTRAILGLEPLQGGRVELGGAPVVAGAVPPELRRQMQVVFQDPFGSFNPRHRVARLVAEPFHLEPIAPEPMTARVAEALEAVGLRASDATRFIHEFSGGQRQRIAIARAIVIRPKLVILDEAVSALDVSIRARILDLLADLQARYGLSYLFISHDLSVVRRVTDRVLVMRAGEIVEEGPTEAVFTAPDHPYTKSLIAAAPRMPRAWLSGELAQTS